MKAIDIDLEAYHYDTLCEMAEAAGLDIYDERDKTLRKNELIARMQAEYFTEVRVETSWRKLNEQERAVVNRLLLHDDQVTTKSFRRELIRARLVKKAPESERSRGIYHRRYVPYASGYVGDPHRRKSSVFEDVIARLALHGLVFSRETSISSGGTPYKIQCHPGRILYVPEAIRRYLPDPEPVPPPLADWEPDQVKTRSPTLWLRDLYLYWDFVRRHEVTLIQSGFVSKRPLREINETLLVPDPLLENARREHEAKRLYLLRQFLEILKLAHKERGMLRPTGEEPLDIPAFWRQNRAKQLRACLEAWPKLEGINDLGGETEKYNPRYAHARRIMRDTLKRLQIDTWLELEDILAEMRALDVNFLFAEHREVESAEFPYYHSSHGGYYGSARGLIETFERLESQFVEECLTDLLHQLGVVELGYAHDTLWSFRVTPLGQAALEGTSVEQPEAKGKLIVQPNFEVIAMGPVSLATLARLDLFADRLRANRSVFEYELSRESVYQAQRRGVEAVEVIRFLEEHSITGLPQNVRRSLEEWAAYHERIVFRSGVSLLQAADADLLQTLEEDSHIGKHLARSISPEAALVGKGRQRQLMAALVERGCLPAVSDAADGSVIAHEDGAIRPIHAVPSFQLQNRLARLAEETDDGEWHLTPASVRQAGGGKDQVLRIVEELDELHRGSLPGKLVKWIKAEGNYYGDASAETLTLIEFRDQATLKELREHPSLEGLLTPFQAGDRALAVIPSEDLPRVEETLSRFGVEIEDGLSRD